MYGSSDTVTPMLTLVVWFGFILVIIGLVMLLGGILYKPPVRALDGTTPERKWWEKPLDKILELIDKLLDPMTPTKVKLQILGFLVMVIGVAFALGALYVGAKSDLDDKPDPTATTSVPSATTPTP